jgi:D-alanyl-D-alanine carboxypeptidase
VLATVVIAAIGSAARARTPNQPPAVRGGTDAGVADRRLDAALTGLVAMPGGPPGAIAIVQRLGEITVHRAGVRDLISGAPIESFDRMRLASASKAFSGAVALALVAQHRLSLRDTIARLLPKLPPPWGRVTLAEALNHTSGLPDFTASKRLHRYLIAHPHATPSPLFLLQFVAREPLAFTPGSRYRYSNTDNFIVALMAQAATRRSYNDLLATQVYAPLGLRNTSLPRGFSIPEPYLLGYELEPDKPPEDVSTIISASYAWASGGMVSTPADSNRFIRGYVSARLFGPVVQSQQHRFIRGDSQPIGPGQNSAGLALFRYRTRCGTVYGHTGNTFGYTQFMAATLDGRRSVTVSVSEQLNQQATGPQLAVFRRLRQIEEAAVCAALA